MAQAFGCMQVFISDFISSSVKSEIKEFQDYRQICWLAPDWSCFSLFRTKKLWLSPIKLGKKLYIYKIVCNHLISWKTFLRISFVKCWNYLWGDFFTQFSCWFLKYHYLMSLYQYRQYVSRPYWQSTYLHKSENIVDQF